MLYRNYIPYKNRTRKNQFRFVLFLLFSIFISNSVISQEKDLTIPINKPGYKLRAEVINGDTVAVVDLPYVHISTEYVYKNRRQYEQWTRIKYNVKVVYPYAILAAAKLKEYDRILQHMSDPKIRKAYLKVCEKDLRNQFEDELKDLSITQGRVLMKLIDRETGKTTYEVVKEMRGSFQACMWQAVARIFGNNMKDGYDAVEDIMIERAIKLVESGQF